MLKKEYTCDCNIIHHDKVEKVLQKMDHKTLFPDLAEFFKIIGDPTRIKILFALDEGEMCVCDIANVLKMSKSSISHQLAILRKKQIVRSNKVGKEVYYSLDDEHVKKVFDIGIEHITHKKI